MLSSTTQIFLKCQRVLQVVGDRRALHAVVGQPAEERLPPVLAERDVGGRRGDRDQTGLIEHRAGGLGLAGERRADQTDGVLVVDDLRGDGGGLLRVTLGVERLQLHLAAGVRGVVLVDGQLHAILDVDAKCGVGTREGAGHRDRHRRARRLPVPGGIGGFHAFGRLHLGAVLVDLYLLDDLQVGLRLVLFGAGLIAAGNAKHNQARATESKCTTCHATSHVPTSESELSSAPRVQRTSAVPRCFG